LDLEIQLEFVLFDKLASVSCFLGAVYQNLLSRVEQTEPLKYEKRMLVSGFRRRCFQRPRTDMLASLLQLLMKDIINFRQHRIAAEMVYFLLIKAERLKFRGSCREPS
jgi:hypothetical protein